MKRIATLLLGLALASVSLTGCYISRTADQPDELERTWQGATVIVPLSRYLKEGRDIRGTMRARARELDAISLDQKIPMIVFLHGCSGLHGGYRVDLDFLQDQGYAVVAPDSFSRAHKPKSCDWRTKSAGSHLGVIGFRLAEAEYAVERVKEFPWVDADRVILMGLSEGGITTANYDIDNVAARVVLGWTCQVPWPPLWGLDGPQHVPVMSVVSDRDRWFTSWLVDGDCGEDMGGFADATSVVLDSSTHHVLRLAEARDAVAAFLSRIAPPPRPLAAVPPE